MTSVRLASIESHSPWLVSRLGLPADAIATGVEISLGPEIGRGGFGTVYRADQVEGRKLPLVVKQYVSGKEGANAARLIGEMHSLIAAREQEADIVEAFVGIPIAIGRARVGRKDTVVSVSLDLTSGGLSSLDSVASDHQQLSRYRSQVLPDRLAVGERLARSYEVFEQFQFLHGDINAENVFVRATSRATALPMGCFIDLDQGVIQRSPSDRPVAAGKADDFIAPEVKGAAGIDMSRFSVRSEHWSLGWLIHYAVFGVAPLFFLKDLAPATVSAYLSSHIWPEIDTTGPLFLERNRPQYEALRHELSDAPPTFAEAMRRMLHEGYADPDRRPTASEWRTAIGLSVRPPEFTTVRVTPRAVPEGGTVRVEWRTERATSVAIDGSSRTYPPSGQAEIEVFASRRILLQARSPFGEADATTDVVRSFRAPRIRQVDVPVPCPPQLHHFITVAAPTINVRADGLAEAVGRSTSRVEFSFGRTPVSGLGGGQGSVAAALESQGRRLSSLVSRLTNHGRHRQHDDQ